MSNKNRIWGLPKPPHLKKDSKKEFIWKLLLALLVGVIAPAGYLIGISFYKGYLSAFGVHADFFPLSLYDVYHHAYYAIAHLLNSMFLQPLNELEGNPNKLIYFLYAGAFMIITLILFLFVYLKMVKAEKKSLMHINRFTKVSFTYFHAKNNDFIKAIGFTGLISYLTMVTILMLLVLSIIWVAFGAIFYYKGAKVGSERRDFYLTNSCTTKENDFWSNCASLQDQKGKTIYEGILITQYKEKVAFFTKKGSFITKIPDGGVIVKKLQK